MHSNRDMETAGNGPSRIGRVLNIAKASIASVEKEVRLATTNPKSTDSGWTNLTCGFPSGGTDRRETRHRVRAINTQISVHLGAADERAGIPGLHCRDIALIVLD
jgi:hypothetical protein